MLVLSRKIGEEIVIAGGIRLVITDIRGKQVRIGITAPAEVRVDRAEIAQRLSQSPGTGRVAATR